MQSTALSQQAPRTSVAVDVPDGVWVLEPEREADAEALEEGLAPELGLCSGKSEARRRHEFKQKHRDTAALHQRRPHHYQQLCTVHVQGCAAAPSHQHARAGEDKGGEGHRHNAPHYSKP